MPAGNAAAGADNQLRQLIGDTSRSVGRAKNMKNLIYADTRLLINFPRPCIDG